MIEFEALEGLEEDEIPSYGRGYLGMSSVGAYCTRKTVYEWLFVKKTIVSARFQRIFNFGHDIERQILEAIYNKTGCIVDNTLNDQLELIGPMGHWLGHPDGILVAPDGSKYLLEIKSHKASSFRELVKDNDLFISNPAHYYQCQAYMSHEKMPDKCIYIGMNKDTCEIYMELFEISFNKINSLKEKMEGILEADSLPSRVGPGRPSYWLCKACQYSDICYKDAQPDKNCRTCANVELAPEGRFKCSLTKQTLPLSFQKVGCDTYVFDKDYFGF